MNSRKNVIVMAICILMLSMIMPLVSFAADEPADSAATSANIKEVAIPVEVAFDENIAGAEFRFEKTPGLEFVRYEKAESLSSAMQTPVVEKNGLIYFGFFAAENKFTSTNGKFDIGMLVFNIDTTDKKPQQITIVQQKFVKVIDKDNTESEIIEEPMVLDIVYIDGEPVAKAASGFFKPWMIAVIAVIVILIVIVIRQHITMKKKLAAALAANASTNTTEG